MSTVAVNAVTVTWVYNISFKRTDLDQIVDDGIRETCLIKEPQECGRVLARFLGFKQPHLSYLYSIV